MYLLNLLTGLLPARLQPYAKAVYPTIVTAAAVGVQWVNSGALDVDELKTAAVGAFAALLTLGVPNKG